MGSRRLSWAAGERYFNVWCGQCRVASVRAMDGGVP